MSSSKWLKALAAVATPTIGNVIGLVAWPLLAALGVLLMEVLFPVGALLLFAAGAAPGVGRSIGLVTHRKRLLIIAPLAGLGSALALAAGLTGSLAANMALWSGPPPGLKTANDALVGFLMYGSIPMIVDLAFEVLLAAALSEMRSGAGTTAAAGVIGAFSGAACVAWGVWFGGWVTLAGALAALVLCAVITAGGGAIGVVLARSMGWYLEEEP